MAENYIGCHVRLSKCGIKGSVEVAKNENANFYQIFLKSPQSTKGPRHKKEDLEFVKKELIKNNMKIVIHASYMLNFCNPPDSFIHKHAIKSLNNDLEDSINIGAIGVVVHMGKNVKKLNITNQEAQNNFVIGIKNVLKNSPKDSIIIFETGAGQGSEICTSIVDLGKLYRCFSEKEKKRITFCLDTCHMFSAGYDLSNVDYLGFFEEHIEVNLGWDNVSCIHLNDSQKELNCHLDRHEDLGYGCINLEGLSEFVRMCIRRNIPIVLETPVKNKDKNNEIFSYKKQIELIKTWI